MGERRQVVNRGRKGGRLVRSCIIREAIYFATVKKTGLWHDPVYASMGHNCFFKSFTLFYHDIILYPTSLDSLDML